MCHFRTSDSFSEAVICNTIDNEHLNVMYQCRILSGTIVDTNCDSNNPTTLTEVTFELDEQIDINGQYEVRLVTNGIAEVLTECGTPSISSPRDIILKSAPRLNE